MNNWIFQANPDSFDIDSYITGNVPILWTVRQKHYQTQMSIGDRVFLWRSRGTRNENKFYGVVAEGKLSSSPFEIEGNAPHLWRNDTDDSQISLRVEIELTNIAIENRKVIQSKWLENDPITSNLKILKMRSLTNYLIENSEAERISHLLSNTGNDWSRKECIAALKTYYDTKGQVLSQLPGSPISNTALLIGRVVSGTYNKLLNFRYLDPEDSRTGLSNINQRDREVWNEFYDNERGMLKISELNQIYSTLFINPIRHQSTTLSGSTFVEAPNDDPEHFQMSARRARRGQGQFRNNLLEKYGRKCVITGKGPEEVLEAVHILSHAESGINELDNGLLMRADIHHLFDEKLISINPDTKVIEVDTRLRDTDYWQYNGNEIRRRVDGSQISDSFLRERNNG